MPTRVPCGVVRGLQISHSKPFASHPLRPAQTLAVRFQVPSEAQDRWQIHILPTPQLIPGQLRTRAVRVGLEQEVHPDAKRVYRSFFSDRSRIQLDGGITSDAKSGGLPSSHNLYVGRLPKS